MKFVTVISAFFFFLACQPKQASIFPENNRKFDEEYKREEAVLGKEYKSEEGLRDTGVYDNKAQFPEFSKELMEVMVPFELEKHTWSPSDDIHTPTLDDIMTHIPAEFRNEGYADTTTVAHESLHGITSHMRYDVSKRYDFFGYVGDGKGVMLIEPDMHYREIAAYVPQSIREIANDRFELYMIQQAKAWKYTLYVFDEWDSYLMETYVALEMLELGLWPDGRMVDQLDGMLEFLVFSSAALAALEQHEPQYLERNPKTIALYLHYAQLTLTALERGLQYEVFTQFKDKEILDVFLTSPDATELRASIKRIVGAEWTQKLFKY